MLKRIKNLTTISSGGAWVIICAFIIGNLIEREWGVSFFINLSLLVYAAIGAALHIKDIVSVRIKMSREF